MTLLGAGTSHRQIERVTGIDRKTIRAYGQRLAAERSNSPGVATGSEPQTPPPRPPAVVALSVSACEPNRTFIEEQLRLKRNFMAIYQDLVDKHGFNGAYNSVKRFAGGVRRGEPEQFDRMGRTAYPRQRSEPGAGHVRGGATPSVALAAAGHAVIHRGAAHGV